VVRGLAGRPWHPNRGENAGGAALAANLWRKGPAGRGWQL